MIWRKYRNCQLAFHVEQRNRHNKIVNELASACVVSLAEFAGRKIQNADGRISKKIGDRMSSAMSILHPYTNSLLYGVRTTNYRVCLWARSYYQLDGENFSIQGEVCIGEYDRNRPFCIGVYVPPKEVTLLETNFDAETVLAALNEMDSVEDRLNSLKNHFSDFTVQRD